MGAVQHKKPIVTIKRRRIPYDEALEIIEKDNQDFNNALAHMGFCCEGEFPFRMSKIINKVTL